MITTETRPMYVVVSIRRDDQGNEVSQKIHGGASVLELAKNLHRKVVEEVQAYPSYWDDDVLLLKVPSNKAYNKQHIKIEDHETISN